MLTDREKAAYRYTERLSHASSMLETLLKTSEIQDLFESFYKLVDIPLAIIDLDANVLLSSRWQRICMEFHRVHPDTCAKCIESDRTLATHLEAGQIHAMSPCPNGLTDCASPIILDGQHVANVFVGQFLTEKPDEAWFARQARELGFDEADYLAALSEVPIVAQSRIPLILDLLAQLTRVITNLSVERMRALDERTRQALIMDTVPQAIFWKDRDGRYLGCNAVFARAVGLASPKELVGKTDFDLPWPQGQAEVYRGEDQEVIASGRRKLHIIEETKTSDDRWQVLDTTKIPLAEPGAAPYGVLGVYSDITYQVRAEEMLRESEEKFRTAFMTSPDGYVVIGRDDGRILEINDQCLQMFGLTREECIGRTSLELGFWPRQEDRLAVLADLARDGVVRDREILAARMNGQTFNMTYSATPFSIAGQPPLLMVAGRDITERKRAEARLKALSDQSLLGVYAFENDAFTYVNDAAAEMLGYSREELIGKHPMMIVAPKDREFVARRIQERISGEKARVVYEFQGIRKDGTLRRIRVYTSSVKFEGRTVIQGNVLDVTDQWNAEKALRENEEKFRAAFMTGSDAYVIVSRDDGRIVEANDQLLEMYGYSREECVGRSSVELGMWARPEQREAVFAELQERGHVRDFEILAARKGGETFHVFYSVMPLNITGQPPLCVGAIHDVTERYRAREELKRSAEALQEQNALFRAAFMTASDGYIIVGLDDSRILNVSEQFLEIFGYTREECVGRSSLEVGFWAKPEERAALVAEVRKHGRVRDVEVMGVRKGGQEFPVSLSVTLLPVPDQQPLLMVALRDITERKASEERIRILTRLLRTTSEVNELIVREHDRDRLLREACRILVERGELRMSWIGFADAASGRVIPAASAGFEEGYLAAADIRFDDSERGRGPTGTSIRERRPVVIDDWDTDHMTELWRKPAQARHYRSSAAFPLEVRGRVIGALTTYSSEPAFFNKDAVALLGELAADLSYALNAIDVEAEKTAAEQALQESEERFRRIVETSAEGIWVVDAEFRTAYVNPRMGEILGCRPEDLIGRKMSDFVCSSEIADHDFQVQSQRAGVASVYDRRYRRQDGTIVECAVSAVPISDDRGEFSGSFAMLTDVTERAASEREVSRLAAAIRVLNEGIVIVDPKGVIEYTNPAFTEMTGCSREEAVGRNWSFLVSEHQPQSVYANLIRTIKRGETWQGFLKNVRKDGMVFEEEATILPVRDAKGRIINFVAVKRDVSKERSLLAQLNQAQKMEAVGTLAGGVAHDFNNLLQGMMMMLQVARRGSPEKSATAVEELDKLVRRGSALTKQLLLFSRKEVAKPELLDLNGVIRDATKFLRRLVRENVAFTIDLTDQLLPVTIDRGQMEQALMNLVVNAADAMPGGGRLRIATSSTPGRCIVTVEDTGHGIPNEIRDRVLEPFFTTKGREKGTGLGLSVVHGIVTEHQGTITFDDRAGGGTVFTISLPRVEIGEPDGAVAKSAEPESFRAHRERLLVIEDEESVRNGLVALLQSLEYEPTAVGSAEAALALPDEPPFDLILADLVLPGRPGTEAAEELARRWPAVKVVLMSGYTSDAAIRAAVAAGELKLLEKPFDAATLGAALRDALQSAPQVPGARRS